MTGINFNNGNIVGEEEEIDFDSQPLITTIAEIGKEEEDDDGGRNAAMRWMWSNTRIQLKFQSNFDWLPRTIKMGSGLAPNLKNRPLQMFFYEYNKNLADRKWVGRGGGGVF